MFERFLFLLSCLMMSGVHAGTAMTVTRQLSASDAGATLNSGLYTVPSGTLTLTAEKMQAGLSIGANQTVYILVNKGSVLSVTGGAAVGRAGAGAGIYVPKGSKLYLLGEGEVRAYGGVAAQGGAGGVYTAPSSVSITDDVVGRHFWEFWTSPGGAGGYGGGGAGAGFGYAGGVGGVGGAGGAKEGGTVWVGEVKNTSYADYTPEFNKNGNDGASAPAVPAYTTSQQALGSLYVIGTIHVTGTGGGAGASGTIDTSGSSYWGVTSTIIENKYSGTAARGGYGGAGAGGASGQGFGLGGVGGGGGGGGGSGGVGRDRHDVAGQPTYSRETIPVGGDGKGGIGPGSSGISVGGARGTSQDAAKYGVAYGGNGGDGATSTEVADTWTIYKTGEPTIVGAKSVSEVARPTELTYTITFDNTDGKVKTTPASISATTALPYPSCHATLPTVEGDDMIGWYDQRDGKGTCFYKKTKPAMTAYPLTSDVTLYPYVSRMSEVPIGITVNGETVPPGASAGNGWGCTNCVLTLDGSRGSYVLAGTNETGYLSIRVTGDANLVLNSFTAKAVNLPAGPGVIALDPGVTATLSFTGENTIMSTQAGKAGIHCPLGASVTLVAGGMDFEMPEQDKLGHYRIITTRMNETVHLKVSGGTGAAAVGGTTGVANGLSGKIIFKGISVFAEGGEGAAAIGRGVLSADHTTEECEELTISTGCSVRPLSDTGDGISFVVDPAPHNEYDMRVWFYRFFDGRMTYRFWLPSSETELGYKDVNGAMSYKVKVTVDTCGNKTTGTW